jgi:protein-S-isoprenylcysteine O-methyltransferase Ste14
MEKTIVFIACSIPLIILSWRTLFNVRSHGFYRFLSWEMILWLFLSNYKFWFVHPFSPVQVVSWFLLIVSAYLAITGALTIRKKGKSGKVRKNRKEKELYRLEETTELIESGVFRYIRHPLYSSLICLTWGIFLKNPTLLLAMAAVFSTICLFITATIEERECILYFGDPYREYMKKSKRFFPFIL